MGEIINSIQQISLSNSLLLSRLLSLSPSFLLSQSSTSSCFSILFDRFFSLLPSFLLQLWCFGTIEKFSTYQSLKVSSHPKPGELFPNSRILISRVYICVCFSLVPSLSSSHFLSFSSSILPFYFPNSLILDPRL